MALVHFLNVNKSGDGKFNPFPHWPRQRPTQFAEGQCSIIEHDSGRVTVIDICNAHRPRTVGTRRYLRLGDRIRPAVNPIDYLIARGIRSVHRFILTHPHLDHMDGIEALFETHTPEYFWDLEVSAPEPQFGRWGIYGKADWKFYLALREMRAKSKSSRLIMAATRGEAMEQREWDFLTEDGLSFLIPSSKALSSVDSRQDLNAQSPPILFRAGRRKVLFGGDLPGSFWGSVVAEYSDELSNVDVLVAPHHGQFEDFSEDLFRVANPIVTVLGNCGRSMPTWSKLQLMGRYWVVSNIVGSWTFDTNLSQVQVEGLSYEGNGRGFRGSLTCPMSDGSNAIGFRHVTGR